MATDERIRELRRRYVKRALRLKHPKQSIFDDDEYEPWTPGAASRRGSVRDRDRREKYWEDTAAESD